MKTIQSIQKSKEYQPKAYDYDARYDVRRIAPDGTLQIDFGQRPDRKIIKGFTPKAGTVLKCWPWKEGDSAWHQDLGEGYPEETTTVDGVLFNAWGVLSFANIR